MCLELPHGISLHVWVSAMFFCTPPGDSLQLGRVLVSLTLSKAD